MPYTKELPWLKQSEMSTRGQVLNDPNQSLLDANASESTTDTGELKRNWGKGIYTINTPRTLAATGWIGGESITLGAINIQANTANASVAVQSLDGVAVNQSRNLLISLGTRAIPKDGNKTPFYVEPLDGTLTIQAPQGLKLYTHGILAQLKEVPVVYQDGRYTIKLDGAQASNWLFLK
jgi:hypothetical protein